MKAGKPEKVKLLMEKQAEVKNIWGKKNSPFLRPNQRAKVHQSPSALPVRRRPPPSSAKVFRPAGLGGDGSGSPPPLIRRRHVIPRPLLSPQGRFLFFFQGGPIPANRFFPPREAPSLSPLTGASFSSALFSSTAA